MLPSSQLDALYRCAAFGDTGRRFASPIPSTYHLPCLILAASQLHLGHDDDDPESVTSSHAQDRDGLPRRYTRDGRA